MFFVLHYFSDNLDILVKILHFFLINFLCPQIVGRFSYIYAFYQAWFIMSENAFDNFIRNGKFSFIYF
ncbi:MAG: hypothetical protein B6I20_11985 [Bacteroidetes bacterium 4572_117]|nr:MAG: hypothetical protein B6I20_11985 [Bacteroidetes bacterium 4572_117]